jgi:hypothetical protein
MPAPQTNFVANTDKSGYDPATLSDDEDDNYSQSSRSTWASSSDATILGFADGYLGQSEEEALDWRVSRIGGLPVRRNRRFSCSPSVSFFESNEKSLFSPMFIVVFPTCRGA